MKKISSTLVTWTLQRNFAPFGRMTCAGKAKLEACVSLQEPPAATSQHAAGALFDRRDMEATPDEGRSSADVAAEPTQVSNSHADTAPQRLAAPAVDLASPQAAPASGLAPEAQQPAAELQPRQDNIHDSTQELQHATAAETGNVADDKLPVPASLGDEAPGQAPAGRDDRMLTGRQAPGQTPAGRDDEALTGPGAPDQTPCGRDDAALAGHDAPDQAMAADWDRTLAGDEAQTSEGDEVLTGPGLPSGEPDQAPISTATETAASAAASESAVQQQQPAPGALSGPPSLNEQPQVHSEAAVAVSTPAKRPVEVGVRAAASLLRKLQIKVRECWSDMRQCKRGWEDLVAAFSSFFLECPARSKQEEGVLSSLVISSAEFR